MKRILSLALVLGLFSSPVLAGDVSVMPTLVEVSVPPGEDYTTVVQVRYTQDGEGDTEPVRIVLASEDWGMDGWGRLSFQGEETADHSAKSWVVFSPAEAEVRPGELLEVRMSVIVPEDAEPGEYRTSLIVQPRSVFRPAREGEKRIELRCRLATILYLEVPPVTRDAELEHLQVTKLQGRWTVVPTFRNLGDVHLRVFDSWDILPISGDLADVDCVREMDEAGVVLPGKSRQLAHPVACDLESGWYRLTYRADLGEDLPLFEGETTFVVPPEVETPPLVAQE